MTSLRERIKQRFEELYHQDPERWVNGGEVERFAENLGYKASNASRRLRELETGKIQIAPGEFRLFDPVLEVRYTRSERGPRTAWYRLRSEALPPKPPQYRIIGDKAVQIA